MTLGSSNFLIKMLFGARSSTKVHKYYINSIDFFFQENVEPQKISR